MVSESIQPGLSMHQWFQRLRRPAWPGRWQSTCGREDQPTAALIEAAGPSQRSHRGGGAATEVGGWLRVRSSITSMWQR